MCSVLDQAPEKQRREGRSLVHQSQELSPKGDIENERCSYFMMCILMDHVCVRVIHNLYRIYIRGSLCSVSLGEKVAPASRGWQDRGIWAIEGNGCSAISQRAPLVGWKGGCQAIPGNR